MAAMTSVVDMYPLLMPELPGLPAPLLLQTIQQVIREFCVETDLWRESQTYNIVADEDEYTLTCTATGAEIQRIVEVKISDVVQELRYITYNPTTAKLTLDEEIIPTEAETSGLVVKVSLRTTNAYPTTTWDAGMLNRWHPAICNGVKAFLMMNARADWGNPQLGMVYLQQYRTDIALARREVWHGYKNGTISVAPRTW
jgi:hypothetical protein